MSKLKHAVKTAFLSVILAIIITGTVWLGLIVTLKTNHPLLVVSSGSMRPTLEVGDLIIVKGVKPCEIQVGDIIAFRNPINPKSIIVHRVKYKFQENGKWYFTTQGDNNPHPISWERKIPSEYIIGKVIYKMPYVGYISLFMRKPEGIALIVFLALILIILNAVRVKE